MAGRRRRMVRGLTLVEVLLSISLISVILSMLMGFYWTVSEAREEARQRADRTQLARHVLQRMAEELRGCLGNEQLGLGSPRLVGSRRSITFLTTTLPPKSRYEFVEGLEAPWTALHDVRLVHYFLQVDPEEVDEEGLPRNSGIYREEQRTLRQISLDESEPIVTRLTPWAPEMKYLEFRYFDGVDWNTEWQVSSGNSLPQMIMITISEEPITLDEWEDVDLELEEEELGLGIEAADEYRLDDFEIDDFLPGIPEDYAGRQTILVRLPAADQLFGSRIQNYGQQMVEETLGVEGGLEGLEGLGGMEGLEGLMGP